MVEQIGNDAKIPPQPPESTRPVEQKEAVHTPAKTERPETLDSASRKRLAEDTIEISAAARRQQLEQQKEEADKSREENNLQFTGNHFYTLGLTLIRQEEITPPSEPDIKP